MHFGNEPMNDTPRLGTLSRLHRLLRSNWITSTGAALMTLAVFGFVTLSLMHVFGGAWAGPYVGLVGTIGAPIVFVCGLVLVPFGLLIYRSRLNQRLETLSDRPLYLARAIVVLTVINFAAVGTVGFTGATYMSSTQFCTKACHDIMGPEEVAYLRSPHQRVDCVACHVAPGAQGYIAAKLNGTKQLYHTIFDDYERPIPTPVEHLVPASQTCEHCHWPEKYLGTKLKVKSHFRSDEKVSAYTNVLLMRTGGTRPDGASVGIHWHVHPDARVEYVATDRERTDIPWLRIVRTDGTTEVFAREGFDHEQPPAGEVRRMDCTDCHNRSAHAFELPGDALDIALANGQISRDLPFAKQRALAALEGSWTRDNASDGIRQSLQAAYAKDGGINEATRAQLESTIPVVVDIWLRNNWPDRKLVWNTYPDMSTHYGCFRCHDGRLRSTGGRTVFGPTQNQTGAPIRDGSCNRCHTVLSENEEDPAVLEAFGLKR